MGLVVQAAPATEPMTVSELKTHLRINTTTHDTFLGWALSAARIYTEKHMNRTLVTTTWDLFMDGFDDPFYARKGIIYLPRPPLASVTSITYFDAANVSQTWSTAEYAIDTYSEPASIREAYGYVYPQTYGRPDSVKIRYIAGYGAAAAVPENVKQAVRFLAGHLFENRESTAMGSEVKDVPMAYNAFAMLDQVWVF